MTPATSAIQPPQPQGQDPLAQLRDIIPPEPVSWWPPALGWWLLGALLILMLGAVSIYLYRRYQARNYRREALRLLDHAQQIYRRDGDTRTYLERQFEILRRTALTLAERIGRREQVAGLTGSKWLRWLDCAGGKHAIFNSDFGRALLDARYRAEPQLSEADVQTFNRLCRRWIKRHHWPAETTTEEPNDA